MNRKLKLRCFLARSASIACDDMADEVTDMINSNGAGISCTEKGSIRRDWRRLAFCSFLIFNSGEVLWKL